MDKREFIKIVGQNMKKYRDAHGLTQEKFAEKAGISLSFCAAAETARKALEVGQSVEMITGRIEKRQKEKEDLQAQIAIEMNRQIVFTAPQIRAFLCSLKRGKINDENNRKGIINIFLRAIYLWDDRMTLILNGGDRPIEIDGSLLDEIEDDNAACGCSSLVADAPPQHLTYEPPKFVFVGGLFGIVCKR